MVPLVDVFKFNLILKQCERDNKAFETLFDFYYPRIKLHIHKKFPDACADDVRFWIKTKSASTRAKKNV